MSKKNGGKINNFSRSTRMPIRIIPLLFLFILFVFSLHRAYIYGPEMSKKIEIATSSNLDKPHHLSVKNGEIVQEFCLYKGELKSFFLVFENYSPEDTATLYVTLEDKKGNVYYQYSCPTKVFGEDEVFYLLGEPEKRIKRNGLYAFHIRLDSPNSELTVRASSKSFANNFVKDLTINGVIQENEIVYINQTYEDTRYYLNQWMVLFLSTFFICILFLFAPVEWPTVLWEVISPLVVCTAGYSLLQLMDSGRINGVLSQYVRLNIMLLLGMILLLKSLLGRFATYVSGILLFSLGITDYYVIQFKGESFLITDLKAFSTTMEVVGNYNFIITPLIMTCIIMILCVFLVQLSSDIRFFEKSGTKIFKQKNNWRHFIPAIVSRLVFFAVGMILFMSVYNNKKNAQFDFFRLDSAISKDGYLYSNLCVFQALKVKKPNGYSNDEIKKILSEISEPELKKGTIRPKNIIVIMNESLADLRTLGDIQTDKEYLPFINGLKKNTVKGTLCVNTFGGGTCITEYEFLTGNTKAFFPAGLKPYFHACQEPAEEGIVRTLRAQGYYTVAMHPNLSTNWNRNVVYPLMGFNEFYDIASYDGYDRMRKYVSDRGDYDFIIDYVENYDREEDLFIFNVTMQNHGGYDTTENMPDEKVRITNMDNMSLAENYLGLVKQSDLAFDYLTSYFSSVDEPTMIVIFGDHLPHISADFYDQLYGKKEEERSLEEKSSRNKTFYLIWTNYDSDFDEKEEISANYLGSYMLQCAGVELTDYNRFLLNEMEVVPVIGLQGYCTSEGNLISYGSKDIRELDDYRILQYLRVFDRNEDYYDVFRLKK